MIKLIKSSFYHEAETKAQLVDFITKQDVFSMNDQCRQFEVAFAKKQQRKHALFVSNGSVANLLLIQALLNAGKLSKGDKVGFSALTWPTNVMPLIQLGLIPVALDCDIENLNVSSETLVNRIDGLNALFITNVLGFCADIPKIKEICESKNVILIEDNCESLGSKIDGKLLGNFGIASTFSTFIGHHLSTIEGGMVCVDDEDLYDHMIIARAHGWDRNLNNIKQEELRAKYGIDSFYAKYTFYDLASNFRPNEINGFIGNTQIKFWDEIVKKRAENFASFYKATSENDDFYAFDLSHMEVISNFSMPIICKTKDLAKKYREKFANAGVEIRPVIAGNIAKQPFYKKYVVEVQECPNADIVHENGFYFGNNPELTQEEISKLCSLLER